MIMADYNLHLLANVAASIATTTKAATRKKPTSTRSSSSLSVSSTSSSWSLQVRSSDLELCFIKKNNIVRQASSKPNSLSHVSIDALAQVAFAHQTSTLWALVQIPRKRRSFIPTIRRPNLNNSRAIAEMGIKRKRCHCCEDDDISDLTEEQLQRKATSFKKRRTDLSKEKRILPLWAVAKIPNKRRPVTCSEKRQSLCPISKSALADQGGNLKDRILPPKKLRNYIAEKGKRAVLSDPKLVITKKLYATDVDHQQCRFSVPMNQVIDGDFLKPEERSRLDKGEGINVTLLQPCFEEINMCLKKWKMNKSSIYVLNHGWISVLKNKENELHLHAAVQLWSFHCNGQLYFALIKCKDGSGMGDEDDDDDAGRCGSPSNANVDLVEDKGSASDDESTITLLEQD